MTRKISGMSLTLEVSTVLSIKNSQERTLTGDRSCGWHPEQYDALGLERYASDLYPRP